MYIMFNHSSVKFNLKLLLKYLKYIISLYRKFYFNRKIYYIRIIEIRYIPKGYK
jgi:hypothetical protein